MNSRLRRFLIAAIVVVGVGVLGRWLATPAWLEIRGRTGAPPFEESLPLVGGQGVSVAVLGGFRSLSANVLWLRTNLCWERRDLVGAKTYLHLATVVEPQALYFWLNGARMIAYDMPRWAAAEMGDEGAFDRLRLEYGRAALTWLNEAERFHPREPAVVIERANISLHALQDVAAAAEHYRLAAELPRAPSYAARLHAQLLRRAGRPEEAYAWLVGHHATLIRSEGNAAALVVLERIRELETELGVAAAGCYRPREE